MSALQEKIQSMFPSLAGIPQAADPGPFLEQRQYLCDGELRTWGGPLQEIVSPICVDGKQRVLGGVPLLTDKEVMTALGSCVKAFDSGRGYWPTLPVAERILHVAEFTARMKEHREEMVRLLMWEIGKTRKDSEKEFDRTVDYILETIDALKDLDRRASRFEIEEGIFAQIRRAPLGVVLCMGPFNYPLNETFTTLIPALIMGNVILFKPPKLGVLLFRPLLEPLRESFPPGVINTVYGDGPTVIGPLMASGKIDVLAFIGSARVGNVLKRLHPMPNRLRCVLGLNAKNPAILLDDADLDLAVAECLQGSLTFNGQRCTALKILFVQRRLFDPFLERMAEAMGQLRFGMPWEEKVTLTPLPEPGKPAFLKELVEDAWFKGARVCNDEGGLSEKTFFYPALIAPVSPDARLYNEEQFGPVVPVVPFDEVEAPIRYVTESSFGQQVSIFGADPDRIAALIDPLVNQVCRVNLNSQCQRGPDSFPFTGRKDSAEATLSVSDALRAFSIRTLVAAKQTELNTRIVTSIVRGRKSNFLSTDFIL